MLGKRIILIFAAVFVVGCLSSLFAQTTDTPLKPTIVIGEVTAVEPARIALQTKDGSLEIALSDKTEYKRVSAEKPSLSTATASALSDISVGDKVAVSVIFGADKKPQPARTVYLMTKADIAQKQTKESEEWRTRGIAGRVVSIDQLANKITVEQRSLMGSTNIVVTPKENVKYLRYAPDSVKFSEAKASNLAELKPGDMMRALGDKSMDGTTFAAEEIVSGAFQTRAGKVKSVDAVKNEIVVTDLQTEKDLTIAVVPTSILKKFPEEMATRMAQFQMGGQGGFRPGGQGSAGATGQPNNAASAPGQGSPGQGRMFGGGGPRGGGIDEMLERFPNITPADLKVGDVIAVSSTKTARLDHITAIKLLSGVEPFLRAAQMTAVAQQGNGPRRQLDLNIPGLDGFGTP
jgi:hypothetical protein